MSEPSTFEEAVLAERMRDPKLSRTAAMRETRKRYPDLLAKFAIPEAHPTALQKSDAVLRFEKLVDRLQRRDQCSRLAALTKAAREYPAEQQQYATCPVSA